MLNAAPIDAIVPKEPTPIHPKYALLPIDEGFNWEASFAGIEAGAWYLVVFRSKHRPDADEALLTDLDNAASASARTLPGFLHYFIGTPLPSGECLSFCLWNSQAEARAASAQPAHREAIARGLEAYEYYSLERYNVSKRDGLVSFARL